MAKVLDFSCWLPFEKLLSYCLNYSSHKREFEITPTAAPRRSSSGIIFPVFFWRELDSSPNRTPLPSFSLRRVLASGDERGPGLGPQGSLQEGWLLGFQASCLDQ